MMALNAHKCLEEMEETVKQHVMEVTRFWLMVNVSVKIDFIDIMEIVLDASLQTPGMEISALIRMETIHA